MKITHRKLNAAIDTGHEYWYFTRHGLGPGMMPNDVSIMDWYEEGYKTWIKLNKLLTTEELDYYDIQEQQPPVGAVTHNGDVIEACSYISSSEVTKVDETDDAISYVVTSDDIDEEDDVDGCDAVEADTNIAEINLDQLKKDIEAGCIEYLTGPKGGFLAPGAEKESRWDMTADEVFVVEVSRKDDHILVEVRAELSYDGMFNMCDVLDNIISKYDEDAYFDMEEPGIADAYIFDKNSVNGSEDVSAAVFDRDRWNDGMINRRYVDISEDDEIDEVKEDLTDDFSFDVTVEVTEVSGNSSDWKVIDGDLMANADDSILEDADISKEDASSYLGDLVEWYVPFASGAYNIKGDAHVVYSYDDNSAAPGYIFNTDESSVSNIETSPAVSIESATDIRAYMSEEDLDYAIEHGKPFDIDSFKKWKHPGDPDAIHAEDVEIGDIIDNQNDASEVNIGTVFKVLDINNPEDLEDWGSLKPDYTFRCECIEDPGGMQNFGVGTIFNLHYWKGDEVGHLVPM